MQEKRRLPPCLKFYPGVPGWRTCRLLSHFMQFAYLPRVPGQGSQACNAKGQRICRGSMMRIRRAGVIPPAGGGNAKALPTGGTVFLPICRAGTATLRANRGQTAYKRQMPDCGAGRKSVRKGRTPFVNNFTIITQAQNSFSYFQHLDRLSLQKASVQHCHQISTLCLI